MGLTPLEGLVMGTRSGDIDPAVFGYLADRAGLNETEVTKILNTASGLAGLSGVSNDMRTVQAAAGAGNERARLALDVFVHRLAKAIAAMVVGLERLDALVFTGGIGEKAAAVRARVCKDAAWLGLDLDEAANDAGGPRISRPESRVSAWAVPTNEELLIARHTRRLLAGRRP
jgi:acetate kinase